MEQMHGQTNRQTDRQAGSIMRPIRDAHITQTNAQNVERLNLIRQQTTSISEHV